MSARRAARPVSHLSHDFRQCSPRSVSAREIYLGQSVVRIRVHGPHRRVLTHRPVAWTRKPPPAVRRAGVQLRVAGGLARTFHGRRTLLEHSASEAFAAEARQAQQADRKLATDLGRPGPSGPDAGDHFEGLARRPHAHSPHVERLELLQEGVVGLLQALERYDPLAGFAILALRRALRTAGDAANGARAPSPNISRLDAASAANPRARWESLGAPRRSISQAKPSAYVRPRTYLAPLRP